MIPSGTPSEDAMFGTAGVVPLAMIKENFSDSREGTEQLSHQTGQQTLKAQIPSHEPSSTPIILHGNPLH